MINPIIRRELLEVLRTPKALALQFALALACSLLVLVRWPTQDVADLTGDRAGQVLRVFGYGLLIGILLLVPAFPATSLVREKVKGTLALLLNSPMSPVAIYLGKLGGVLGFTLVLLAMTLPAAAACFALGGSWSQGGILALYGVLAVAAVQLATLGLWVSSRSHSTVEALLWTYGLVLVLAVGLLGPHLFLRGGADAQSELAAWLRHLSPIPAVMEVLGHGDVGSHGMSATGGLLATAVTRYVAMALAMSLLCAILTVRRLNHTMLDRARAAGVMTQDRSVGARAARRLFYLIDPQSRSGSTSLWINPVLVKEFRSRRFGRSHWMLRLVALSAIVSLALSCLAALGSLGWGVEYIGGLLVLFQIALLILFAPSLGAGLISSERESGTWQLLRITPLSPGRILFAKLVSVGWPLLLLLLATLPGYVVLMTLEPTRVAQVQRVVACLALTAVFAVLLSAFVSSLYRSTAAATTAAYVLVLGICVSPFLLYLGAGAPFGHTTVQAGLVLTPVAAALQAADVKGFRTYELLPLNWYLIGGACVALLVLLRVRVWQLYRPE